MPRRKTKKAQQAQQARKAKRAQEAKQGSDKLPNLSPLTIEPRRSERIRTKAGSAQDSPVVSPTTESKKRPAPGSRDTIPPPKRSKNSAAGDNGEGPAPAKSDPMSVDSRSKSVEVAAVVAAGPVLSLHTSDFDGNPMVISDTNIHLPSSDQGVAGPMTGVVIAQAPGGPVGGKNEKNKLNKGKFKALNIQPGFDLTQAFGIPTVSNDREGSLPRQVAWYHSDMDWIKIKTLGWNKVATYAIVPVSPDGKFSFLELVSPIKAEDSPTTVINKNAKLTRKNQKEKDYNNSRAAKLYDFAKSEITGLFTDRLLQTRRKRIESGLTKVEEAQRSGTVHQNTIKQRLADLQKERVEYEANKKFWDERVEKMLLHNEISNVKKEMKQVRDKNKIKWKLSGSQHLAVKLGSGGQGAIYVAERTGDPNLDESDGEVSNALVGKVGKRATLAREKSFLKRLAESSHPNIVKFVEECCPQPVGEWDVIVLERASEGSLRDYWDKRFVVPETDVWRFMIDCFKGLTFLHTGRIEDETPAAWNPIAHFDLKPDNILVHRDKSTGHFRALLTDFGGADFHPFDFQDTRGGGQLKAFTWTYLPNEFPIVSLGFDVYSLGASFHDLLTNYHPRAYNVFYNPQKKNVFIKGVTTYQRASWWPLQPLMVLPIHETAAAREAVRQIYMPDYVERRSTTSPVRYPQRSKALSYHLHRMLGRWTEDPEPSNPETRLPAHLILDGLLQDWSYIKSARSAAEIQNYDKRDADLNAVVMALAPFRTISGVETNPGFSKHHIKTPLSMDKLNSHLLVAANAARENARLDTENRTMKIYLKDKFVELALARIRHHDGPGDDEWYVVLTKDIIQDLDDYDIDPEWKRGVVLDLRERLKELFEQSTRP